MKQKTYLALLVGFALVSLKSAAHADANCTHHDHSSQTVASQPLIEPPQAQPASYQIILGAQKFKANKSTPAIGHM